MEQLAQIKRLFEESELVSEDSEAIRKFSDKYIVPEKLVSPSFRALLAPRISRGHFFLAVFFRVTHDGLSERVTTRSLSGFPLSSKTSISKFQFDLDYCQARYHEPVFDIKFAFTFTFFYNILNSSIKSGLVCLGGCYIERAPPGVLPVIAYTGRFPPKGIPFSGFRSV